MSIVIYNKIYKFLITAKKYQINTMSIIYFKIKENYWVFQTELKSIVEQAVGSASNIFIEDSFY